MLYELKANNQKSFYGKALVELTADGRQILYSYNTPIIEKTADGNLKRLYLGWTATTGKHIKAFCGLDKKGFLSLPYELTEQDKAKLYNGEF